MKLTAHYRQYQFVDCGHIKKIHISSVRTFSFECSECRYSKLENEAKKANLKIIKKSTKKGYCNYQFLKCEHTQLISSRSVRVGSFVCNTCEETSWNLPSKVYLLKISYSDFDWLKLGYSNLI